MTGRAKREKAEQRWVKEVWRAGEAVEGRWVVSLVDWMGEGEVACNSGLHGRGQCRGGVCSGAYSFV